MIPAGLRNNNPLNVKGSGWQGQTGNDPRGHAIFSTAAHGVRAAIVTLRTYWFTHKLRTIAAILSRWAPASDTIGSLPNAPANSPKAYSEFVARRCRLTPTEQLSLFAKDRSVDNKEQLAAVLAAMAAYEIGAGYTLPASIIEEGMQLL